MKPHAIFVLAATFLGGSATALEKAEPASCPDLSVKAPDEAYDASRAWIHEPGWFKPLDDPETVPISSQDYGADEAMLVVQAAGDVRAYPVRAMAYHHVANETLEAMRTKARRQVTILWAAEAKTAKIDVPAFLEIDEPHDRLWRGNLNGPVPQLLGWIHGRPVEDLTIGHPDLDSLFRRYYEQETDEP